MGCVSPYLFAGTAGSLSTGETMCGFEERNWHKMRKLACRMTFVELRMCNVTVTLENF